MIVYPATAGFKGRETSREAAEAITPICGTLRDKVLDILTANTAGLTADEVADKLRMTPFSIRPRVSELARLGLIEDTTVRRANKTSGRIAIVWRAK